VRFENRNRCPLSGSAPNCSPRSNYSSGAAIVLQ
jgi:hypothetical protein